MSDLFQRSRGLYCINGYFRSQAITGQQRYATEITHRLLQDAQVTELLAPPWLGKWRAAQWAGLQFHLPTQVRGRLVVSLTSRTPVLCRSQLVTVHDIFPLTNPEWFSKYYVRLHRSLLRHNLHAATGIIVVSEPVREQVSAIARSNIPILVAPNAPTDLPPPTEAVTHALDLPGKYLLAVGSLEPRKNLTTLLDAYSSLERAEREACPLLIVGGSAKVFADHGINPNVQGVRFLGRVNDEELSTLYANAHGFVSVSHSEGFGIPIVEAAQAGVARLVLSDIPVYRWLASEREAWFVSPTSTDEVADGLRWAIQDDARTSETLSRLVSRFSWEESARTIHEFALSVA